MIVYLPAIRKHVLYKVKGNTKFWYGVMNLVQMNMLEAILQYSVIVVAVEIKSNVMEL